MRWWQIECSTIVPASLSQFCFCSVWPLRLTSVRTSQRQNGTSQQWTLKPYVNTIHGLLIRGGSNYSNTYNTENRPKYYTTSYQTQYYSVENSLKPRQFSSSSRLLKPVLKLHSCCYPPVDKMPCPWYSVIAATVSWAVDVLLIRVYFQSILHIGTSLVIFITADRTINNSQSLVAWFKNQSRFGPNLKCQSSGLAFVTQI